MTKRGIFSLVFEFFLLVMALGTDIREFLIVAVCVGGLLIFSFLSMALAVSTLDFKSEANETELYRGEGVGYTLTLRGPVILPVVCRISVKAADNGDITDKDGLKHAFLLTPSFKLQREYYFDLLCAHTGYWKIGIEKLHVSDMFGMFSLPLLRTRKVDFTTRIAVLPKVHNFVEDSEYIDVSKGYGGTAILNSENGEMLGDSRLYRDGDSLRRINWKQSVRMRKLFTRQYEMPEVPRIAIAIDTACHDDGTGTIADMYCETAVSLANYYIEQDNTVNIVSVRATNSEYRLDSYFKEPRDLSALRYELMEIPFFNDKAPLDLFRLDNSNFAGADKIYILTANPSPGMFSAMEDVLKQGREAVCIVPQLGEEPLPSVQEAMKETGIVPVIIKSVDEIAGKVGGVL